jgi:hypothetical protein
VPVIVLEPAELTVKADDTDDDLEELDVLVDVIDLVVVFVVVVDGLTKAVGIALRVKVVVFVDVFDWVLVEVDITTSPIKTLPSPSSDLCVCGLKAMEPIAVSNKSQRIPIYI